MLVTSFLTPPPTLSEDSPWRNYDPLEALKQNTLFSEVIGVQWQAFRTEGQTRAQLEQAGFTPDNIQFRYDSQGMFPTVIAKKSGR